MFLGFRVHTGWAAMVGVRGLEVVVRARVVLLPEGRERFVYHAGAEMGLDAAAGLIAAARREAERTAVDSISEALGGRRARGAAIWGGWEMDGELEAILRSHARIHAAEGALYAGAVRGACERMEIPVRAVQGRAAWADQREAMAAALCGADAE